MMSYNDHRPQRELEAPRYYNVPMTQGQFVLIANQYPQGAATMGQTAYVPAYQLYMQPIQQVGQPMQQQMQMTLLVGQHMVQPIQQYHPMQQALHYQGFHQGYDPFIPMQPVQIHSMTQQLAPAYSHLVAGPVTTSSTPLLQQLLLLMPLHLTAQHLSVQHVNSQLLNGQLQNSQLLNVQLMNGLLLSSLHALHQQPLHPQLPQHLLHPLQDLQLLLPQVQQLHPQVQRAVLPQTLIPLHAHADPPQPRPVPQNDFLHQLQELLPVPPLARAPTRPDVTHAQSRKRTRRKSKFSKRQDDMIVHLKKEGRTWVEIADMVGLDSYLAARNRYQVIVGQQGNNNSLSWTLQDRDELHRLLDPAELEKWQYIAKELAKVTGKNYTARECREYVKQMFWLNPVAMGVYDETLVELQKEKRVTDRLTLQPPRDEFDYLKRYPELQI